MSVIRIATSLSLALVFLAAPALAAEGAQTNLQILRDSIRANKKALVAVNLTLSDQEAQQFWPVYDRYQKDLAPIQDRFLKVLDDYTSHYRELTDEKAMKIAEDYLAIEADRARLRQSYLPEFAKVLSGKKVARFYQIENKMDAVLRYDLAGTIPVVEE